MNARLSPIFRTESRSEIKAQPDDHDNHGAHQRFLIAYLVEHFSCTGTIQKIAQKEGEGNERGERVFGCGDFGKEGNLQRTLTLTIDGGQEAHDKIYESQEEERSCTLQANR